MVGCETLEKGAPPVTIAFTPVSLGTNGVLVAVSNTMHVDASASLPTGLVGSALPALGPSSGATPPYPTPTSLLPPGHQLPTGVLSV